MRWKLRFSGMKYIVISINKYHFNFSDTPHEGLFYFSIFIFFPPPKKAKFPQLSDFTDKIFFKVCKNNSSIFTPSKTFLNFSTASKQSLSYFKLRLILCRVDGCIFSKEFIWICRLSWIYRQLDLIGNVKTKYSLYFSLFYFQICHCKLGCPFKDKWCVWCLNEPSIL